MNSKTELSKLISWKLVAALAALLVSFFALEKVLTAAYPAEKMEAFIEIEGGEFGSIGKISGIEDLLAQAQTREDYTRITLSRDFVTSSSLYQWAKEASKERKGPHDIHVVLRNKSGDEISRYVMKMCQPLSWSIESASAVAGGFREQVEIAVQEIAIF